MISIAKCSGQGRSLDYSNHSGPTGRALFREGYGFGTPSLKRVHFDTKNFCEGLPTVATALFQRAQLQKFLISDGTHINSNARLSAPLRIKPVHRQVMVGWLVSRVETARSELNPHRLAARTLQDSPGSYKRLSPRCQKVRVMKQCSTYQCALKTICPSASSLSLLRCLQDEYILPSSYLSATAGMHHV